VSTAEAWRASLTTSEAWTVGNFGLFLQDAFLRIPSFLGRLAHDINKACHRSFDSAALQGDTDLLPLPYVLLSADDMANLHTTHVNGEKDPGAQGRHRDSKPRLSQFQELQPWVFGVFVTLNYLYSGRGLVTFASTMWHQPLSLSQRRECKRFNLADDHFMIGTLESYEPTTCANYTFVVALATGAHFTVHAVWPVTRRRFDPVHCSCSWHANIFQLSSADPDRALYDNVCKALGLEEEVPGDTFGKAKKKKKDKRRKRGKHRHRRRSSSSSSSGSDSSNSSSFRLATSRGAGRENAIRKTYKVYYNASGAVVLQCH
jgi:hypothetical protein